MAIAGYDTNMAFDENEKKKVVVLKYWKNTKGQSKHEEDSLVRYVHI